MKIKEMAKQAVVAALYVALTLALSPVSFGAVQFRVSSMMHQLVAYKKNYAIGLLIGVVISNAFSPLGVVDILAGLAVGILGYGVSFLLFRVVESKSVRKIIVAVMVTVATVFVALELHILYNLPFFATWLTVAAGQALTQIAGIPVLSYIDNIVGLE